MNRVKFVLLVHLVTVSLVKSELNNIPNEKINNGKILKDKNAIFGTPASEVEKSVKSFVLTLIDPLEKSLLHDFRKTSFKRNFQKTVNIYTQIVVENIRGFRRKLTIFKNNNSGEKKVAIPNGNDTLTNLLENGLTVATEFTNFIIEANEISTKFLLGKQQSPLSKSGSLQIMDFLIFTSDFFVYVDCAIKDRNIGKSIKYLYSHSPDKVVEYLEKKIKTPPKNRLFNATESICYSIDKIISGGYKKCIHDLNNVYSCIQHQIPIKSTQNDSESYKILKSLQQSFSKDWMKSVRVLEPRCKIQEVRFDCDFGKKSKSTKNQVREMVEIFIGRKIESGSSLSKIVKRFSKVISKHHVTKNLVRNFYDYIAIWRGGQKKKSMLRNVSKKNSGLLKKLEKVTKSLDNYKKGVVEQLLSSIAAFNQIPTYLEKSLKKAVSKQSNQTLFGSILIYLARLLRAIFDRNSHKSSVSFDYHKNYSNELIVIQEEFPYFHSRMSNEDIFDNMLRTMNNLRDQHLSRNKSAFNGGLTNILLALMFLETLSAVTLLISQNINISHVNEQYPVENEGIPELDPNENENENDNEENENENIDNQEQENAEEENEQDDQNEEEEEEETAQQFKNRKKRFLYHNSNFGTKFSQI